VRNASQVSEREAPFQLRGGSFTMMVLKVVSPQDASFFPQLLGKIRQAPSFFRNAPLVLDLDELVAGADFDLLDFVVTLRSHGLLPVGVQGGSPELQRLALDDVGLPAMPAGRQGVPAGRAEAEAAGQEGTRFGLAPGRAPTDPMPPKTAAAAAVSGGAPAAVQPAPVPAAPVHAYAPQPEPPRAMVLSEPVRSGRQIYSPRGDLVVLGPVSPGAELLADGSIHIYGPLRGRALAGLSGDRHARIFCQSLEAELVSIAGLYRISEDIDPSVLRRPVQIWLDEGYLRIDPLV
jgi:septum site-determining protein MinC